LTTTATHQEVRCRVRTMIGPPERNRFYVTPGESPKGFLRKRTRRVRSGPGMHLAHTRRN